MKNIRFFERFIFAHRLDRSFFIASLTNSALECLYRVFMGVYFIRVIINVLQQNLEFSDILWFMVVATAIYFTHSVYRDWYMNLYKPKHRVIISKRLSLKLFNKAINVPLKSYDDPDFYDQYMMTLQEKNDRVINFMESCATLIANTISTIYLLLFFTTIDALVIIFSIFPLLSAYFFGKRFSVLINKRKNDMLTSNRKKNYVMRNMFSADTAQQVRTSKLAAVFTSIYKDGAKENCSTIKRYGTSLSVASTFVRASSFLIPYFGAIFYLSYRAFVTRTILIGDFTALSLAILNFAVLMIGVVNAYTALVENGLFVANIIEFLHCEETPHIHNFIQTATDDSPIFEFKNVVFAYKENQYILNNVTTSIFKGEKVALVGPNGAGKSTFAKLLMNLYQPNSGSICYKGIDINDLNQEEYRSRLGVMFQEVNIYAASIWDNLVFNTSTGEQGIHDVLSSLDLHKLFEKDLHKTELTREFDSDGMVLSGGNAQKLALARFLYRDFEVAILDEPSSTLDPIAEDRVLEYLFEKCTNKTMFIISHRMSCVKKVDRIIYMENGQIVESGTHSQLMALNGKYKHFFKLQAENYQEVAL